MRWGRNLALLTELRNLYEPNNFTRRIVGFDTWEGFPSVAPQDGRNMRRAWCLTVTENYEQYLESALRSHEKLGRASHIQKFELVKGDVAETLPSYLRDHPETIIALAYLDMDIYEPTKTCLQLIPSHLTRGSIVPSMSLHCENIRGKR